MSDNRALYEQIILEHNKKPRNFREMEDADRQVEGYNPLCGDHFTIYVKTDGNTITDVSFTGAGCAISKSSASIMTAMLKGKTHDEAKAIFESFHDMVTSDPNSDFDAGALGKLKVFGGVREFPLRIKCATLAWHTLASALEGHEDPVTTE